MVAIVRAKKKDVKVFYSEDLDSCLEAAYNDYKEQMDKYYERGACSPCDNFNELISFEKFKSSIQTNKSAGWITMGSEGDFDYQLDSSPVFI